MNHEIWNEIGNLYFMCGAYEPAIHAYLRSIKMENTFGRSYSNLAMSYVQIGKYREAIKIYRRGIELLADQKEKAATWNRLGILYRQIKEYDHALEAYQRADLIMPQEDIEHQPEARNELQRPLTLPRPDIDLDAILAKGGALDVTLRGDLSTEINAELEMAEAVFSEIRLEDVLVEDIPLTDERIPPAPVPVSPNEWKPTTLIKDPLPSVILMPADDPEPKVEEIIVAEIPAPLAEPASESAEVSESQLEEQSVEMLESLQSEILEIDHSAQESSPAEILVPLENMESSSLPDISNMVTNETDADATQYSQTDYPLSGLTPEEIQALDLEIIKYQQAISQHPRSYILWESLGEAYKSAGQYKDAIHAFQKAISLNPTNPMCHYRLGLVYAAEQKEQDAIRSFEKVLEIDPRSPQAHASLASQYRKMGFEDIAREHVEKARAMQVEGESDYNLACLEAICGNNDRALELLEVALQTKQTYVSWAQNDPDFHTLQSDRRFQTLLTTYASITG